MPSRQTCQPPTEPVICSKAYRNADFMNTPAARNIRVQCEFQEPGLRLAEQGVHNIVMFFGSARAKSREDYEAAERTLVEELSSSGNDLTRDEAEMKLDRLRRTGFLVEHYDGVRELSRRFTTWSMNRRMNSPQSLAAGNRAHFAEHFVATGGGPGMMQAANEGAWLAGGRSLGLGISLPFEAGLNPFVTEELAFEFHYFFTRKFWMAYKLTALVVAPGGFGTMDELFELLTLKQTGKIKRPIPVVLFGASYWSRVMDLQEMCNFGMISQADVDGICCTDSVEEAFEHLTNGIEEYESSVEYSEDLIQFQRSLNENSNDNDMRSSGVMSPSSSQFVGPFLDPISGQYLKNERGQVVKSKNGMSPGRGSFSGGRDTYSGGGPGGNENQITNTIGPGGYGGNGQIHGSDLNKNNLNEPLNKNGDISAGKKNSKNSKGPGGGSGVPEESIV